MNIREILFSYSLIILSFTLSVDSKIICDVETYILTGIEYANCQDDAFNEISNQHGQGDPCPLLKRVTEQCAQNVKGCFDDRGWKRGMQMYVDLAVLQFPSTHRNHLCSLFNSTITMGNTTVEGIPQKLPGELCSIEEESILLESIRQCVLEKQTAVVEKLKHGQSNLIPPPRISPKEEFKSLVCPEMDKILRDCVLSDLSKCYDEEEADFHKAFIMENLRSETALISTHFLNGIQDVVSECPAFRKNSQAIWRSFNQTTGERIMGIVGAVCLLTITSFGLIIFSVYFFFKYHLDDRVRAIIHNKSYNEFSNEAGAGNSVPNTVTSSSRSVVNSETQIDIVMTENPETNRTLN